MIGRDLKLEAPQIVVNHFERRESLARQRADPSESKFDFPNRPGQIFLLASLHALPSMAAFERGTLRAVRAGKDFPVVPDFWHR